MHLGKKNKKMGFNVALFVSSKTNDSSERWQLDLRIALCSWKKSGGVFQNGEESIFSTCIAIPKNPSPRIHGGY